MVGGVVQAADDPLARGEGARVLGGEVALGAAAGKKVASRVGLAPDPEAPRQAVALLLDERLLRGGGIGREDRGSPGR